jgi:hypothetical protein
MATTWKKCFRFGERSSLSRMQKEEKLHVHTANFGGTRFSRNPVI